MRYQTELTIDLPRERVIELFDDTENLSKWMKGLVLFEHLEGQSGEVGAKSKLKFEMGKRKMEMVETILSRNFPEEFTCAYATAGVYNEVKNEFLILDSQHTLYRTEHYFKFESWGMKVMAFLMPGAFKKQSKKYLEDFKEFAESAAND